MARIFISHSSLDNFEAIAFRDWLISEGWAADDVFLDLHGIGAGARWKEALAKANERCEAVLFLVSPHSLASKECYVEIRMAEDMGKVILPVILPARVPEDMLTVEDDRLAIHRERQIVDAAIEPREASFTVEHEGRQRSIAYHAPTLARIKARLEQLGISPTSFPWTPGNLETATPYPGLEGFAAGGAALFLGRAGDIARGFASLRKLRRAALNSGAGGILVVQAASGAGKSSFLKAGLWPRLDRDPDFLPVAILRPASGILTGDTGVGRQFSAFFARHGEKMPAAAIHASLNGDGAAAHRATVDLLNEAARIGQDMQRLVNPDAPPPTPVLAVDQAEELFAVDDEAESMAFLRLLARLLAPPADKDAPRLVAPPLLIWTIRADSLDALLHATSRAGLAAPELFPLPPIPREAYREIITEPLAVANGAGMRLSIDPLLVDALVEASKGADALPLLAYTLRYLLEESRAGAQAHLSLDAFENMGGMSGVLGKRLKSAQRSANAADEDLRRLFVPGLATWDAQAGAAKRLTPKEADVARGELVPLANALVEARLLTRGAGTLEVAHEALLRQPPISDWLEDQKDRLKLRDDLLREAKEWGDAGCDKEHLTRRGERLKTALSLAADPDFSPALAEAADYLRASRHAEANEQRGRQIVRAGFAVVLAVAFVAWRYNETLRQQISYYYNLWGRAYTDEQVAALKPGDAFMDCRETNADKGYSEFCPTMVVIPAGKFTMGSDDGVSDERPVREVTISKRFAVSKFEITFDQWQTCVDFGGCTENKTPGDEAWGQGDRPIINVSWNDAVQYAAWLSKTTGQRYRLLTEAEWEYAARAGTTGDFSFEVGEENLGEYAWYRANSNRKTHPVGEKKPNAFGLYDMHGNVWEWVSDWYGDYENGPQIDPQGPDTGQNRVIRGGGWNVNARGLRSADRGNFTPDDRDYDL
ncbi:MAG: SUMF1/EgtB/PvdO family nonheme iron enzyme, partial [Pseudomonadota bacterium]